MLQSDSTFSNLLRETVQLILPTNKWYDCATFLPILPNADAPDMIVYFLNKGQVHYTLNK